MFYRARHATWTPASTPAATVASATLPSSTTPTDDECSAAADPAVADVTDPDTADTGPVDANPTVAALTRELDLALTPKHVQVDIHSLYFQNIRLLRYARSRQKKDMVYEVGCAITAARTLLDTGAAPSLVTTGFLELVPKDCVIDRDRLAVVGRVLGADGQPLRMEGTVSMAFDLDGQPCRADFVVAVGKPLMILGNDFLDPRQAVVHMNADGEGNGYVTLVSKSKTGHPIHHRAAVSTSPSATVVASVSLADPTSQGPSVPVGPDVQPAEPTGATSATPLPAAELAADALAPMVRGN